MIKQYIIENWLVRPAQYDIEQITRSQVQQAWARVLFAIASLVYLSQHAVYFDIFKIQIILFSSAYLVYNALSIIIIPKKPLSAFRTLFAPLFDTFVVCYGMMTDGGHGSGMFYILFLIIIGNSFRFGNALMIYTQVLCLIGLNSMNIYLSAQMQIVPDSALLIWQFFGLLTIPFYVYLIREKAEKAIRGQAAAEETSMNMLDQGPLPVFTYDIDEQKQPRILYANVAVNEVFPESHTRLIGKSPDLLTLPEDGAEMLNFCRAALSLELTEENAAQSIYMRGRDKHGGILRLLCHASRIHWRDQWIGICYILDITERETLQAQLDAVHRQGFMSTLVAGVVHDFRNVLTNMIGYAEVMQMGDIDDASKEQLAAIIAAGERGSGLITHLLKLSSKAAARESGQFTHGNALAQPLENIIGLARMQLPPYIQLHYCIDEDLHDVAISIIEIEQILLNLINNATQAISGNGYINIEIDNLAEHRLAKPGHPALCIRVSDNGRGIDEESLNKIFDPFWTSHAEKGGSGLGLTMIQHIVKLNKGCIEVKSEPGQGSSFIICLPPYIEGEKVGKPKKAKAPLPKKTSRRSASAPARSYHILLVDDVPEVLHVHKSLLSRIHHTTTTAENGKQALELFINGKDKFDMILTDYRMPVMNGLELIEAIRQYDQDIPILMITAYGEDENLQMAELLGTKLISKPVMLESLKKAINEVTADMEA